MSIKKENNIVWIDLELTGLDLEKNTIVEISVFVTDSELNILDEGVSYVIKHDKLTLDSMNEWCKKTFQENGLLNDLSKAELNISETETLVLNYLKKHCVFKKNPIAGNSIYMDRMFIIKYMPKLSEFLHYRIIDVSSIKELIHRWYGKTFEKKICNHRSRSDILESIEELKWYRNHFFIPI
ncbi:Oligoribonuclease, mitochondrial [Strongyloides ratti]|uniref:Probable oligoribonuclease n=1 Tax=Strongyloides ratti TaxID=34506 RepID=A0A090LI70_STRRB|nr:Oligoribonuclease, mitochondrial [Strongyloides ratti]CEF67833.1 Oligoribonuclease, mitochondrial [Strongyloides ratti]